MRTNNKRSPLKRLLSTVTAAAMLCGGMLPAMPEGLRLLTPVTASAEAASTAVLNGDTLTLSGNVLLEDVQPFQWDGAVKHVVCAPGTVLPADCGFMFWHLQNAESIDLTNADTSNVQNMSSMFRDCTNLTSITFGSQFDTSSVTDMSYMFANCKMLNTLDLSVFCTPNLETMRSMFEKCANLQAVIFGDQFDTSKVRSMRYMFTNCQSLTTLDLSVFDTNNIKEDADSEDMDTGKADGMFSYCYALETIFVSEKWNMGNACDTQQMFQFCIALTGGAGTVYDTNHTDGAYARIDGGAHAPGYLSENTVKYDLSIAGTQVSEKNQHDILGDGVFTYDPESNTLTVKGDYTDTRSFIENRISNLTINIASDSHFYAQQGCILSYTDLTITGNGKLTIEAGNAGIGILTGTLTIKNANISIDCSAHSNSGGLACEPLYDAALVIDHSEVHIKTTMVAAGWFRNGITLKDCTVVSPQNACIQKTAFPFSDTTLYGYCFTEADGVSLARSVDIMPESALKITAQPKNFTGEAGSTAKFTVAASGTGTLGYQWQYNAGSGWKNSNAASAKTAELSFTAAVSRDGYQYRCLVTSASGASVTSKAATLKVKPTITAQPANFTGAVGSTAKFTVAATGAGTLNYQWQYNAGSGWKDSNAASAKTAELSFNVAAARDGYQYRCKVTSSNGTSATSKAATLKVKTAITSQPKNFTGAVGSTAKFTVAATGAGTLSYQWQVNTGSGWKDSNAASAKTAELSFTVTAARDGYQYRCKVTSSNGSSKTSSAAALKVQTAITTQPKNRTCAAGSTAKFTVAATGAGTLSYQWQYNAGSGWKDSNAASAKTATLSFTATAARNGYQYRCKVTSSNGTGKTSSAATLTVS